MLGRSIKAGSQIAFLMLLSSSVAFGQATSAALTIPSVIHLCSVGHCLTYTLESGHFVNYTNLPYQANEMRVLEVRSFTKELVSFSETDTGSYPLSAIWNGTVSNTGDSTASGTSRITVWAGKAVPNPKDAPFTMSWGESLNAVAGSDKESDQRRGLVQKARQSSQQIGQIDKPHYDSAASGRESSTPLVSSTVGQNSSVPNSTRTCDPANSNHVSLATVLTNGKAAGASGNMAEMFCWVYIGAKMGDPLAEGAYANLLQSGGFGVAIDTHSAFLWDKKAAEQGSAFAAYDLAVEYAQGIGTNVDHDKAIYWTKIAMKNPDVKANVDRKRAEMNEASQVIHALFMEDQEHEENRRLHSCDYQRARAVPCDLH